jgi:hypothetical protein
MDYGRFDDLTRSVAGGASTRRAVFRLLAGGALGSLVAGIGLTEITAAKPKHKNAKGKQRWKSQPEGKAPGQLQAEGKGRKKRHKKPKDPKPLPPLPPGCQNCNECQMCQDGTCVPDPALDGVRCSGSGRDCGYCQGGQCAASSVPPCDDGVCPQQGKCCPGEKQCPDPESSTGISCIPEGNCCPEHQPRCGPCYVAECVNGNWGGCKRVSGCCPEGGVVCPLVVNPGYGLPDGCCAADRVFPDQWHGTSNLYCRPERDPGSYWCTRVGFPEP